jgi:hypothetical protein
MKLVLSAPYSYYFHVLMHFLSIILLVYIIFCVKMGTYICTTDQSANSNLVTKIVQVKTTSPKKYCVRPNVGVILPRSSRDFTGICCFLLADGDNGILEYSELIAIECWAS